MATTDEINTANKFFVASQGDKLIIMNPPRGPMSDDDALLLAAYLVSMASSPTHEFDAVLDAVQNT
jgi:hypothetical protein